MIEIAFSVGWIFGMVSFALLFTSVENVRSSQTMNSNTSVTQKSSPSKAVFALRGFAPSNLVPYNSGAALFLALIFSACKKESQSTFINHGQPSKYSGAYDSSTVKKALPSEYEQRGENWFGPSESIKH